MQSVGPPPGIKHFDDYPWESISEQPRVAILPDIRILTTAQIVRLKIFIEHGNTLLITGLTGFYDPHGKAWALAGFPLSEVTGGTLKEVKFIGNLYFEKLTKPEATLPSHLWVSNIDSMSAQKIGIREGEVTATDWNRANGGRVIWIPSLIGIGAWLQDSQPLADYAGKVLSN